MGGCAAGRVCGWADVPSYPPAQLPSYFVAFQFGPVIVLPSADTVPV
jgi:hypothetical protein